MRRPDGTLTGEGVEYEEQRWTDHEQYTTSASIEAAAWEVVRLLSAIVDRLDEKGPKCKPRGASRPYPGADLGVPAWDGLSPESREWCEWQMRGAIER